MEARGGGGGGAIDVSEVSARIDDVADAALELCRLGEAAVCFAVPEDLACGGGAGLGRRRGVGYLDDKDAAC